MTQGSGLYLAGPSLVKAAIGQIVDAEELGGAKMHSEISGTVDFFEKDDPSCLKRLRSLVALLPEARVNGALGDRALPKTPKSAKNPDSVYDLISFDGRKNLTRAICWPWSSMKVHSMNTRPITAKRS